MMNSLHTITISGELEMWVHLHCEKEVGCRNCVRMILENINGECICGRQPIKKVKK